MESRLFVGGEWIGAAGGPTFAVRDAATGEVIAEVPNAGERLAREAVDAAARALPAWRAAAAADRAALLQRAARALREATPALAAVITAENGKPIAEAEAEVAYSAAYLDSAAEALGHLSTVEIPSGSTRRSLRATGEPIGVVAAISPWNFPLAMIARKTAPALAAGCTQVIKPSEITPLSALAFARVLQDAGLPAGVVNVVAGDAPAIGRAWLGDGRVRKLSFTGSTAVGKKLMRLAADQVVRLSLELGGHAPLIVFEDADIPSAVAAAVAGKFRCSGQTCICPNRFLVARSVHDEFVKQFVAGASALRVGRGSDGASRIGPLISDAAVEKVRRHVEDAVARGGRLLTGGSTIPVSGCLDRFFAPTVIDNAHASMLCFNEETFGPVAPITTFDTEDEAIALANATEFGLAAYLFTRDSSRIERVSSKLEFGIIGANTCAVSDARAPFGGVKWSGFGREGGRWGLDEYLSWKYVCESRPT